MRTLAVICLTLPLLVSCGQPMPGDPESGQAGQPGAAGERGPAGPAGRDAVTAGSRLRPLWLVGADGTRMASGGWFYDGERRERCVLQWLAPGPDGTVVCAPAEMAGKLTAENIGPFVRFGMQQ